jgi:L-rhamnose mutarotase
VEDKCKHLASPSGSCEEYRSTVVDVWTQALARGHTAFISQWIAFSFDSRLPYCSYVEEHCEKHWNTMRNIGFCEKWHSFIHSVLARVNKQLPWLLPALDPSQWNKPNPGSRFVDHQVFCSRCQGGICFECPWPCDLERKIMHTRRVAS